MKFMKKLKREQIKSWFFEKRTKRDIYSKTDFKKTKNIKNEKCGIIRDIIEILKITIRFFMPIHLKT